MRTSVMGPTLCLTALFLLTPHRVSGQSANKPDSNLSGTEQMLRNIFSEVHLLRVEFLRASANTYRSQVLLNRIKVEQDHVARLTREVNDIQDKVAETRAMQAKKKARLEELVKKKDAGMVSPEEVDATARELKDLELREQTLSARESQAAIELVSARTKLAELDSRLDEIEREMIAPAADGDGKPAKRRQ